jgi:outer membrane biosynthesis protein TonB
VVLKRIVDFEVAPPPVRDNRSIVALGTSAVLHAFIILLLIFGLPTSREAKGAAAAAPPAAQPVSLPPFTKKKAAAKTPPPQQATPQPQPPPPPPPAKEIELGPDSKKPDAPAKEAAAKAADAETKSATDTRTPAPPAPPPAEVPKPPEPQPPAPQKIAGPRPGDYTALGHIANPSTSPWGPPKLDSASGAPPSEVSTSAASSMGRAGLTNRDPHKWENSFDDETSGRCVAIPDLGKNSDGTPVLASVIGRILDTDGHSPLAGAHLQIMGTQFGTFTHENGEYRLDFDPRLLAKCRVQYVHVVAPGYSGVDLKLAIGPKVVSDDVVLHRGH